MCDEAISLHSHSALCINIAVQAESCFDLQAQIGIFLPYRF